MRESKIRKKSVELQDAAAPSRIRRDPPPEKSKGLATIDWDSPEWEIRLALAGIILFALGLTAVVFDLGEALGY